MICMLCLSAATIESDRGGGGSDNSGAVVAGVLVPLFVIIIIIIVVVVILILWKKWYHIKQYFTHRKSKDSSGSTYIRSSPARPPAPNKPAPPIQYQKTQDTVKYKPNAPPRPNGKGKNYQKNYFKRSIIYTRTFTSSSDNEIS